MSQSNVSANVKQAYDSFYEERDEQWRMLGAKYKAKNIVEVCEGKQFKKVLEVGAGDGSILYYLDQWNFAPEMHAIEISESGVDLISKKKIPSIRSVQLFDGYKIPFADDEFDLVILSHVLEHVEFERMLLREIKRVSTFQVIEVPKDYRFGMDKRMKHFLNYGHINMYSPTSLRFLLQSEGLVPVADKIGMIQPEVTRFNTFINRKQTRTLFTRLKIKLEYYAKKLAASLSGKKRQEELANSYTVLTKKSSDLHIF